MTRVDEVLVQEDNEDIDLDDLINPEPGHERVYCVPRVNSCTSQRFISLMNRFAHQDGFNQLLAALKKDGPDDDLTLTAMGYMITMISMPVRLFHKEWMAEFAEPFTQAMTKQLLGASDKIMKDITVGDVAQIQVSMQSVNSRVMAKEAAKLEADKLKL